MAVQVSYPGVYIEEFAPGAPIQGVGTSTAGFIGPAGRGDLDTPIKITSWDQFRNVFGDQPLPGFFLWYAVRAFFENGGQVCYVVRASNGTYGDVMLQNGAAEDILRVRAREPGNQAIDVQLTRTHRLASADTRLFQPTVDATAIAGRDVTVADADQAAQFRPTDTIDIGGQRVQLVSVNGDVLRLANELDSPPPLPTPLRLADVTAGTRIVRIESDMDIPAGALVAGTILTLGQDGAADTQVVETVQAEPLQTAPPTMTYRVTFRQGLATPFSLDPGGSVATVQSEELDFVVIQGAASTVYSNLGFDQTHPRYFLTTVNANDNLVTLELVEPPSAAMLPTSLPADTGGVISLVPGEAENLASLDAGDFIEALDTLREIDDVNFIAIPERTTAAVQQALIAHCEQLADRFAVLDSTPGSELFGADSVEAQRQGLDSTRGYAALYYPWLRVLPAGGGAPILVPPSGHVCGIFARSDNQRGVHKAPANEIVNGALGVERIMSDVDQGQLNLQGINVIRVFQGGGRPVLWGARTTATDTNWQYVNVRRLFLFLEESIEEGIRWAVFEPNNLQLWQKLKRTIREFLTRVWRDGALFGATAEEAFFVRIDEALNPPSEQALGRLNIEIGVRPSFPAEFIIVRIGITRDTSEISES